MSSWEYTVWRTLLQTVLLQELFVRERTEMD